jgi:hypothetical protein
VLAAFHRAFPPAETARLRRLVASTAHVGAVDSTPAAWELQLRREFLSRYGPARLPLPPSLEDSPLFIALQLSPKHMGPGFRDAAAELFRSPAFLASVALSVVVYMAAWALPEPVFSKAFAAGLTVRLALAVGLLELHHLGRACLRLYEEAQAARSEEELETVAERFGRALGGTGLRALVLVASFGVGKALPKVPENGLGSMLGPPRYAVAGGAALQTATMAQVVVADGTLVVSGVAAGTTASRVLGAACTDGSIKKDGHQWHHLATDKNDSSPAQGGPWTPLFKEIFAKAGMSLDDPANLVYLAAHQGPHPEEYHEEVYQRLQRALGRCRPPEQCRGNLVDALKSLASDVCTPGSRLHRLVTKPQG